jgi:hypothetical protein
MILIRSEHRVGISLNRAVLCPNDEIVYDSGRWRVCPTCQNEDRVWLSRILGATAGNGGRAPNVHPGKGIATASARGSRASSNSDAFVT